MPDSTAELYHRDGSIKVKNIIPGQNLCGAMIPTLGDHQHESKQIEREQLINQYQHVSQLSKENILGHALEEELNEGFELVNADNRLVSLQSFDSAEISYVAELESTAVDVHTRCDSDRDVISSDNGSQGVLENRLQGSVEVRKPKSRWVFSASVSVSITKKSVADQPKNEMQALCNGDNNKRKWIKQTDSDDSDRIEEEGIEIVPLLSNGGDDPPSDSQALERNDRVSLFYVGDKSTSMHGID